MSSPPGESDDSRQLVRKCLQGHEHAQQELIDRFSGLCVGVVSRILGGQYPSQVEDTVQETFIAVFAKLGQWRGQNLPAWIGTIAARRAADVRRRLQRRPIEMTGLGVSPLQGLGASAETAQETAGLADALQAVRQRLTGRQRHLLEGILAGRSRGEMAEELGISPRTLYYDLGAIRRLMAEFFASIAENGCS
jgi:RNA polymerase sigma factor (sigma-70 family)